MATDQKEQAIVFVYKLAIPYGFARAFVKYEFVLDNQSYNKIYYYILYKQMKFVVRRSGNGTFLIKSLNFFCDFYIRVTLKTA